MKAEIDVMSTLGTDGHDTLAEPVDRGRPLMKRRLIAAIIALVTGAVLFTAWWLTPDAGGNGTHTQLGLPECNWIVFLDMPCPTCGYTTSFSHAANGDFVESFLNQPAAALLAVATAIIFLAALVVLLTGAPLGGVLVRYWTARWTWVLIGLILVAWAYKMLRFKGVF